MDMEHVHVEVTPAARVEADSTTRQTMLVRALAAGGTLVVSGVVVAGLPGIARSATSPGRDREILDFALQLEYLQKAFYDGAVASAEIDGQLRDFATVVAGHEGEHVQYLQTALGAERHAGAHLHVRRRIREQRGVRRRRRDPGGPRRRRVQRAGGEPDAEEPRGRRGGGVGRRPARSLDPHDRRQAAGQ